MLNDRQWQLREQAQIALTKAQDNWLAAVEKHGRDFLDPEVVLARKDLDSARLAYLALIKTEHK